MAAYQGYNVNENYARKIFEAQYTNTWLQPGLTCNTEPLDVDQNCGAAHFLITTASTENFPTVVGATYTPAAAGNSVKTVNIVNEYSEPQTLPKMAAIALGEEAKASVLANGQASIKMRRQRSAIACMVNNMGSTYLSSLSAETFSSNSRVDVIGADRASVFDATGRDPNVVLWSSAEYEKFKNELKRGNITPVTNERLASVGMRGFDYDGQIHIACGDLADAANVSYKWKKDSNTSNDVTVTATQIKKFNYIMYNSDELALIDVLTDAKVENLQTAAAFLFCTTFTTGLDFLRTTSLRASIHTAW